MVRKTKEDTEQTYTALLDAAERVFKDKGVAAATLNDIAGAAGMTRGAIYWHFKDKEELFDALPPCRWKRCSTRSPPSQATIRSARSGG